MATVSTPRHPRAAAFAATLSAALVLGMAGTALAAEDLECSDFDLQEEAQAVLDEDRSDPHRLDGGPGGPGDGVACESLPRRGDAEGDAGDEDDDAPATTPATAPEEDGDRGCADFATQARAQAALEAGTGDPDRLDADADGIACEQHLATEGRKVAVFPQGGVATGEVPHP